MSTVSIIENTKTTKALNPQKEIGQYGFPFTLNPVIGCPYACKYCFSRMSLWKTPREFFENVEIKVNLPKILDKELTKLTPLPQHLKRVQINEACDVYHPTVLKYMQKNNCDIMLQILEVFQKHWSQGNKWMLHILTKSYMILEHIEKLKEMKEQVQVEISIAACTEQQIRNIEMFTPSIQKRLNTIEQLSKAGIFVRIMAMPFYGDETELKSLKDLSFQAGAKAFKHKQLNYFKWEDITNTTYDDLLNERLQRTGTKKDSYNPDYIIKSGECIQQNGAPQYIEVEMPKEKLKGENFQDWSVISKMNDRLELKKVPVIDCGYNLINKIDWRYIV